LLCENIWHLGLIPMILLELYSCVIVCPSSAGLPFSDPSCRGVDG
jgi:hypothetical protein